MCRDEADREILLPFEQTGIFYQISHKSGKAMKNVLQMSDIVARKLTPRIIKLVYGRFPVTPCAFSGLMRADSSKIETSIIASTIINTKNILLEIPVTSAMCFRVAAMDDSLRQNPCYRGAMALCAERAMTYMRNIKVCYNFTTDDEADVVSSHIPLLQQKSLPLGSGNRENDDSEEKPPQNRRHNQVMKTFSDNNDYQSHRHTCFNDDAEESVIRPGRCTSTGRMSFCLGNSYLTVPIFEPGMNMKRNSGNNNTFQEAVYTTRRGSKISFNGKFFEEEGCDEDESPELPVSAVPPPLACTNIGSYLNIMIPPKITVNGEYEDYISTSGSRRPSTQPPTVSPPPLPESTSTSGVSSGSTSSVSDGTVSNRGSTESFEYAVPKIDEPQTVLTHLRERSKSSSETAAAEINTSKPRARRPSTFTFSEGCFLSSPTVSKLPSCGVIHDDAESRSDDGSPIYENIKSLLELVTELETHKEDMEDETNEDNEIADDEASLKKGTSTHDMLEVLQEYSKDGNDDGNDSETDDMKTEEQNTGDKLVQDKDNDSRNLVVLEEVPDTIECSNENTVSTNEYVEDNGTKRDDCYTAKLIESEKIEVKNNLVNPDDIKQKICKDLNNDTTDAVLTDEHGSNKCDSSFEASESTTSDDFPDHLWPSRNRSLTTSSVDSEIDESSNVRPSDSSNRWRLAVRKMMNETDDCKAVCMLPRCNTETRYNSEPCEKSLSQYTVEDIAKQLRVIGIRETAVQHLLELNVDGACFQKILDGELSIRECLNGVNLIDQQKISMFIRGWRPAVE